MICRVKHFTILVCCLLLCCTVGVGGEQGPDRAGWAVQKVTARPLSPTEPIRSLVVNPAKKILNNAFIAFGEKITIGQGTEGYSYQVGSGETKRLPFPSIIEFMREKVRYAVSIWQDIDGSLCWAPHFGVEIKLDGSAVSILDLDMDGLIGEKKVDGLCGPASATLMKFNGFAWSESAGYEVEMEGKVPDITVYTRKLPFPLEGKDAQLNRAWAYWMCLRQRGGAPHVEWNAKLADNCAQHANYCYANGRATHVQDKANPHYTPGGAYAGLRSNVAMHRTDLRGYISAFYATAYHCAHMVSPKLQQSAFGWKGNFFVVDVRSSVGGAYPKPVELVWPAHGMTDVNLTFFFAGEDPMPLRNSNNPTVRLGQVILARVYTGGPYKLEVFDDKGEKVDGEFTSPAESCKAREANSDLVIVAPYKDLKPLTRYTAHLTVGSGKPPFTFSWSFTTRKPNR